MQVFSYNLTLFKVPQRTRSILKIFQRPSSISKSSKHICTMNTVIKVGLAVLLSLCLLKMPYGFYQMVRFLAMIGFGILAFQANQQKKQTGTIVYVALAVLFQPLLKVSLGRELWNIVDAVVAIGLVVTVVRK